MPTIDQEITLLTTELQTALAGWRVARDNYSGRLGDVEWYRAEVLTAATALTALRLGQPAAQTGDER